MRLFFCSLLLLAGISVACADIQDPPAKKFGSFRKFSRGVANVAYGVTEIPYTMSITNDEEGNGAAFSLGLLSGVRRSLDRIGVGVWEIASHPFPTHRGGYKPFFKSPVRGQKDTYSEFPPELGFESSDKYVH